MCKYVYRWHILAALLLLFIAACSQAASPTPSAAPSPASADESPVVEAEASSDFLAFGGAGEPDTINSMATMSIASLIVTRQIEEPLVGLEPGTLELRPALATDWEPDADATAWTFTLREGVTFHDGTPFDAEAVVFNFERMANPDFAYGFREEGITYPMFPNIFGGFADDPDTIWESVEAVDDMTVLFRLKQPAPLFPNYLAAVSMGIASPAAIREHGASDGTPDVGSVGTGPFQFSDWQPSQRITLVRNENYWGEQARMSGVIIRFIQDETQRLAELQAGEVDFTINLSSDARETLADNPELEVTSPPPFNVAYLSINMTNEPLDDPRVRHAIAHAIDKQAILEGFYGGVGSVAHDVLPDGLAWARPDDLDPYAYDPERARELLAEAGYPDGFDMVTLPDGSQIPLELWYMPVSRTYYPDPQAIAEAYSSYLADVGIEVDLRTEGWNAYLANWNAGEKDGLVMLGWLGDYSDPNNFLRSLFGPGVVQEAGYENEEVFALLQEASTASSRAEAAALFQEAGRLINQDLPRIPIVHAPPVYAHNAALSGWVPSPTGMESFAPIVVEE